MSTLGFRNSRGAWVTVQTVPATKVKNEFGTILDRAMRDGAVAITRHDTARAVLLSYEEFESLAQSRSRNLDNLGKEFDDLLETMQSSKAKIAMKAAFEAPPAELGRSAVKAAAKAAQTQKPRKSRAA
ncbi:MAG: type II toxin-antitoxin system Phd/YefM family antitoxin [Deltaproteobacteria bacterium]|nr:type II toxin-antitoxin system Phd/YefM family antitoxin [Deltaproteobacteria bacterium]